MSGWWWLLLARQPSAPERSSARPTPIRANLALGPGGEVFVEELPPVGPPRPRVGVAQGAVQVDVGRGQRVFAAHADEVLRSLSALGVSELVDLSARDAEGRLGLRHSAQDARLTRASWAPKLGPHRRAGRGRVTRRHRA